MSEGEAPPVGVVDAESDAGGRIGDAVADAGVPVETGPAPAVIDAGPALLVAVGERSFVDVATEAPPIPVMPVGVGRGVRSVPPAEAASAIERFPDEEWPTESHPLLAVSVDGESRRRAVMDVTVATAEAAHISEYRVDAGEDTLGRVRADGIVVATPAGSPGYARRIGAPVLAPGTGAVVAPIAPFATDPDHWVVDPDDVHVEQVRDEADVELVVDDAVDGYLEPSETVSCRVDGSVSTVLVPESRSRYRRG